MYIQHRIEHNEIRDDLIELKEDNAKMPKRVLNELKAYLFEKDMRRLGIEKDTTECNIDLHNH